NTGTTPYPNTVDNSNSQYAVLGMWALEQAGAEVPVSYWNTVDAAWRKHQNSDGGWGYHIGEASTASMTAAGVATLFITQDYILQRATWTSCAGAPAKHIDAGLNWMDKHISEIISTGDYYTLYGIERIGVASGHKYF